MKIAVLCSFTLQEIVPHLKQQCTSENLDVSIKNFTTYNLGINELVNPQSGLLQYAPDMLFIFLDLQSLMPYSLDLLKENEDYRKQEIDKKLQELNGLLRKFQQSHSCTVVLHNFEVPTFSPLGIVDNKKFGLRSMVRSLNFALENEFVSSSNTFIFDYESFLSFHGKKNAIDPRFYYIADMKLSSLLIPQLAQEYVSYIRAAQGNVKKCIVLDLDNTLWGGIIGEDGFDSIKLGPKAPGKAFFEFQQILLSYFNRGIILAVNSKNNPEDALEVIRNHPHMILRENHFAAMRINWKDKATNIKEIAQELNIGTDSMIFVDDDSLNRELVKSVLPEVLTIDLPKDPSEYVGTFTKLTELNTLQLTSEDTQRGALYVSERQRRELEHEATDYDDFLRKLEMKVIIEKATTFTTPRLSQLTQRTNQFNLTTKRYTEADIVQFVENPSYNVYSVHVKDKLGDNGIVGCVITKNENLTTHIDTFLMSCRVLGRKIENVIINYILTEAKNLGSTSVYGEYKPTKKNMQTQDFYKDFGFSHEKTTPESDVWKFSLDGYTHSFPDYIEVQ